MVEITISLMDGGGGGGGRHGKSNVHVGLYNSSIPALFKSGDIYFTKYLITLALFFNS